MIGIGIIGCGKIAQVRHIPEYLANKDVKIIGVTDVNKKRAEEVAQKINVKAFPTFEEMLASDEIQAVSICTVNLTHSILAIQAMRAGKDVLCEKPMATTEADCIAMVKAARDTKKTLMIGQNQRLTKTHQQAKKLIKRGDIGRVLTFTSTYGYAGPETWSIDPGTSTWFFDRKKSGMGAMADLGIQKTDLIQYLLDDVVCETRAVVTTLDKKDSEGRLINVDDNAICIYKMRSGVIGTMAASWTSYGGEDNSTVIYGTEGIMHIHDSPDYSIRIFKRDNQKIMYDIEPVNINEREEKSGVIDAFVDCLMDRIDNPISAESVLPAMKAIFASLRSTQTGKNEIIV